MKTYQENLLFLISEDFLFSKANCVIFEKIIYSNLYNLAAEEMAHLYIDSAFLQTAISFLCEQLWLKQQSLSNYALKNLKADEDLLFMFKNFEYLNIYLKNKNKIQLRLIKEKAILIENTILDLIKTKSFSIQKIFSKKSLNLMSDLYEIENQMQIEKNNKNTPISFSIYRTFDNLDEIFNLNYSADKEMEHVLVTNERLYEGAGVGVQSGYSTLLTALRYLNPKNGSKIIDLGSGYGRFGLVIGLMRSDIQFKGYEFVRHRVNIANTSIKNFEMQDHVIFYEQDLSLLNFSIPNADIYYMYDPFSEATYRSVLNQLIRISRYQKISIVTKGNARHWITEIARDEDWPTQQEFDNSNLCLFSSK